MRRAARRAVGLACAAVCLALASPAQAQVQQLRWDDPTLAAAVADADLIVLARAERVATNGVAYKVERTLKGPSKEGRLIAVTGLHHPELRAAPPVASGDLDYLVLRGPPEGEGFVLPTPTLGRFPCRVLEGRATVVASLGGDETFLRMGVPQAHFETCLRGLATGSAPELVQDAREALEAERLAGPERVYWCLRMVALFAGPEQRDLTPAVQRTIEKAGPRESTFRVRAAAAGALGRLGGKAAVQTLLDLLADPHRAVQSAAAAALAEATRDKPGTKAFELVVARLVAFAREASPRPTTYADVEDPRSNRSPAPLEAALVALARLAVPEGRQLARTALHTDDLDTIDAGLSYFAARADSEDVPLLIEGMRPLNSVDRFVNQRFARVLSELTREDYGIDPAAWKTYWEGRPGGPPPSPTPTPTPAGGR